MQEKPYYDGCDAALLNHAIEAGKERLKDSRYVALREALEGNDDPHGFSVDNGVVNLGRELRDDKVVEDKLKALMPWKKGPFRILGWEIDAEWRSDLKWDRLLPYLDLAGKRVADIGCNNGYFMFRMAEHNPKFVLGIEPVVKHYLTFQWLKQMSGLENLYFEMLGVEHMDLFPQGFDTIFCLGILYHHTDPVGLLRKLHKALAKGGEIFIDCQGVPGEEPTCLVPGSRYAGASGIWFLPTLSALQNWVRRAGFSRIDVVFSGALSTEEQRATDWAPIKSLRDFLHPEDPTRTCEGYPAPYRFYLRIRH